MPPGVAAAGIGAAGSIAGGALSGLFGGGEEGPNLSPLIGAQTRLARLQKRIGQSQWKRYRRLYGPVEKGLAQYYSQPIETQFAKEEVPIINRAYEGAKGALDLGMAERGLQGSGVQAKALTDLEADRASTVSSALNQARIRGRAERAGFIGLGRGLPATALAGLAQAANTYGSAGGLSLRGAQFARNSGLFDAAAIADLSRAGYGLARDVYGAGRAAGWWGKPMEAPRQNVWTESAGAWAGSDY